MTLSVVKEARGTSSADNNRALSNGRSGEDKYSSVERTRIRNGGSKEGLLCNKGG